MPLESDSLHPAAVIFDMAVLPEFSDVFFKNGSFIGRKRPLKESLKNVFCCLRSGVAHVFCIEAIVSKFIHNYLICREIVDVVCNCAVDSEQQCRFAQLISVSTILEMSDPTYGEDELFLSAAFRFCDLLQQSGYFLNTEPFSLEFRGRMLEAVGNDVPRSDVPVAPACAKGNDHLVAFAEMSGCNVKCRVRL